MATCHQASTRLREGRTTMWEAMHSHHAVHFYGQWVWAIQNAVTGVSYALIAWCIGHGWRVQPKFGGFFSAFIAACGGHHLTLALPGSWLGFDNVAHLQVFLDAVMACVSVVTAVLVGRDYWWRNGAHVTTG